MKIAHDAKKRVVILLWCLTVSLFLWYFAITTKPVIDFFQFINFCIVLFGGGFAYHIVTDLVACPYDKANTHQWTKILRALLVVYIGYLIAGGSLAVGKYLQVKLLEKALGWLVAFFGLLIGMFWSMHFLFKLEHPIRELLSSKLENTGDAVRIHEKDESAQVERNLIPLFIRTIPAAMNWLALSSVILLILKIVNIPRQSRGLSKS